MSRPHRHSTEDFEERPLREFIRFDDNSVTGGDDDWDDDWDEDDSATGSKDELDAWDSSDDPEAWDESDLALGKR